MDPKKSTGPDGISSRLLKLAGNAIIPSLIDLFIWSAQAEEMFESWKLARLTPIFKKDVEEDKENYRPISLLCVPSKILEEEVNSNIVKHVFEENQLMTDRQWAYRRGYSTELLLAHLTETWRKAVDSGLKVAVAFIDFKKAFDIVYLIQF